MIVNRGQMEFSPAYHPLVDRLGIWASALCVFHCILTPVLLSFSAVLAHLLPGDEQVHRSLAALVACFGAIALISGYRKHREISVLLMMAAGLCCIFGTAWFGDDLPSHLWEIGITMAGSVLMIAAHRHNHRSCRACERPCCAELQR